MGDKELAKEKFHQSKEFYCEEKQGNKGGGQELWNQEEFVSLQLEDAGAHLFVDGEI